LTMLSGLRKLFKKIHKKGRSAKIEDMEEQERIARIKVARGKFAHLPGSVEDFMREKQKDIEIENRRWKEK